MADKRVVDARDMPKTLAMAFTFIAEEMEQHPDLVKMQGEFEWNGTTYHIIVGRIKVPEDKDEQKQG